MKKELFFLSLFSFLIVTQSYSQTPCADGMAGDYPCNGYDLLAHIPVNILANANNSSNGSGPQGSDIWGWTDPTTQKEYAIAGMTNSTAFVDITDPINPVFLGRLDSNANNNYWRDIKVYNNYAFIVADNVGNHGMQVFDLTRLRNVNTPQNFDADAIYNGVGSCHNIVINEDKGIAYLVGCRGSNGGGPIFIDISDPTAPDYIGDYTADGYSHDAQVVTYKGPDNDYQNREIYIGSNENEVVILDVTDKENIQKISAINYPQIGYTHQGWFTEDQRFFIVGDETDEQNFGMNTRTLIFDLQDLETPILSSTFLGSSVAIDHNGYVKGNEYFMASYRAGLRVFNIDNIAASTNPMTETGYFDTYPDNDNTSFNGAWSVYPYFSSGNIIINDIERGLFVVRKSGSLSAGGINTEKIKFSISPNPAESAPVIKAYDENIKSIAVYNILGKMIYQKNNMNHSSFTIPITENAQGIFLVKINDKTVKKLILK